MRMADNSNSLSSSSLNPDDYFQQSSFKSASQQLSQIPLYDDIPNNLLRVPEKQKQKMGFHNFTAETNNELFRKDYYYLNVNFIDSKLDHDLNEVKYENQLLQKHIQEILCQIKKLDEVTLIFKKKMQTETKFVKQSEQLENQMDELWAEAKKKTEKRQKGTRNEKKYPVRNRQDFDSQDQEKNKKREIKVQKSIINAKQLLQSETLKKYQPKDRQKFAQAINLARKQQQNKKNTLIKQNDQLAYKNKIMQQKCQDLQKLIASINLATKKQTGIRRQKFINERIANQQECIDKLQRVIDKIKKRI